MTNLNSSDPRVKRMKFQDGSYETEEKNHWLTWEVFHLKKRGSQPSHVGLVHAPNAELAMVMAKEHFGRRDQTANLWIVRSADIYTLDAEDENMFSTATSDEKQYREATGFSVRDKIEAYKAKKQNS